jgi:3-vinyl bacteriochlorophyllide hydratase
MFTNSVFGRMVGNGDCCPWDAACGRHLSVAARIGRVRPPYLYTPEERRRRDQTGWTVVQGVLAPLQFAVFLVSLALVLRFLATGAGESAAAASIVVKTAVLYTIMVTGSIWEHKVFGRYLFARAFFWEDAVSMGVMALHTAYLAALFTGALDVRGRMLLALAAYASYVVNATQFVLKLRAARRQQPPRWPAGPGAALGVS